VTVKLTHEHVNVEGDELVFVRAEDRLITVVYEEPNHGVGITNGFTAFLLEAIGSTELPNKSMTLKEYELFLLTVEGLIHNFDPKATERVSSETFRELRRRGWKL
jgi:hypothetical protein